MKWYKNIFVLTGMDNNTNTSMILLDLLVDTEEHETVLEKMKHFGFWTSFIKCFESYFQSWKFLVCIENVSYEARI